jgi:halimadienyl-diphosphate synthase
MVNRNVTLAFSAEMASSDGIQLFDLDNLQEPDGSIGYSPSATAYFALHLCPGDSDALRYLRTVAADGPAPNVAPFSVFEPAWVLWNLKFLPMDETMSALCKPHLDCLENEWTPGKGVGFAVNYPPKDGDCTSITYDVLTHFGRSLDLDAVLRYEAPYYFRCFDPESTPSISTNIHVLSALREAGLGGGHPAVQKVLHFLREIRAGSPFWLDKWHASPYYTTGLGVIACNGLDDEMGREAVHWIVNSQNDDGSWGYYDMPTAEETAYCLQALALWRESGKGVRDGALERGAVWLAEHIDPPYPPLWIGKCLYCPVRVVRSAILSALVLVT